MNDLQRIAETLKTADNEATRSPYWLILDPMQNISCNIHVMASQITGPFFCRADAEMHLFIKKHHFSDKARVYCLSGHKSIKYDNLCIEIGVI
jgi:hypothetical protein